MHAQTLVLTLALSVLAGCASGPKTTEFKADRVIGRSDELSSRPDWVSETVSVKENGDKIQVVGIVEVPGDSRPTAAFKASDASARGFLANKVETQVTKIVESSDTGFSMDEQKLQAVIREVSRVSFSNIDVKSRYWEKVARTKSDGQEELVLKAFSLVSVPAADVKKMVSDGMKRAKEAPAKDRAALEKIVISRFSANELDNE